MSIDDIMTDFTVLDDWEDRYRYIIELGRALEPLDQSEKTDATKVRGCASQVWLVSVKYVIENDISDPTYRFRGESDAHIVQGLIAILLAIYNDKSASQILNIDASAIFNTLGLNDHLSPQRANGLRSMITRIHEEATESC
ncbi:MAG: SufE family protein [Hyphomicrobiaceae bacterium]|nr:SufE family protein [Hyphomicrobiaceae bacterium]